MVSDYLKRIYISRYFWWHLTLADLRAKYQRTALGLLWSIIQPLAMTLLFAFVLSNIFNQPVQDTILYIYSGLICWDVVIFSSTSGSMAFMNAAPYMKQFAHPIAIYPLRSVLVGLINFGLALIGLICLVVLWQPGNVAISWISLPFTIVIFLLVAWPLAIICAIIGTLFRDFSQLLTIALQALWFVSPVFFATDVFINAGIGFLVYYNPIYHLLELIRAPFLYGQFPTLINYGVSIFLMSVLWCIAVYLLSHFEKRIILYL
jgi:lipopolysaccharide transport system permease protein